MLVLQERKYHGRQITLSRKVFRYLFYRKANIRVDVTEDVLAFGIVLHKFFTEEETAMNYTYIVQCADGTLYTGWTNCLARRMKAHNEGKSGAKYIAEKAGVDDFIAEAKPEDKMEYIKKEQQAGKLVAMMGDGTNDAPALALNLNNPFFCS